MNIFRFFHIIQIKRGGLVVGRLGSKNPNRAWY